jgi:U3 small nucleolar RNA-associated protein 10
MAIMSKTFDLRRKWTAQTEAVASQQDNINALEPLINATAIKLIYKLNDSTFRPMFSNLMKWASEELPKKDRRGCNLRLQSIYGFMATFFESFKSIVTSYAIYIIDNATENIAGVNVKDAGSRDLWKRTLIVLTECFKHDQDDFWQSPAHFGALAPTLVSQLSHASTLPVDEVLTPAIVEFAAAADSADHHKELNTSILRNLRSESARVRIAAVKIQQTLTDRLGEEWLSMLPEMLPFISELQEDDDENVEKETHRWIVKIEGVLGESLNSMLQ